MKIGVDLGNYSVKTSEKVYFLSKITEVEKLEDDKGIVIDKKQYFIGEGQFQTDWNKSKKENLIPMLFAALAKSNTENIFQVVLGLPIQQYKANRDGLKDFIMTNKAQEVVLEGKRRMIVIQDLEIAPEGASAYHNLTVAQKLQIGKKQLLIVDIGGRTTDISLFKGNHVEDYKTIPVGVLNIYSDIVDSVNERYTQNFKLEDGEDLLNNGLFLNGKEQDISFVQPLIKNSFDEILKEMNLNFNLDQGYVLLTGGGSKLLEKPFKKRLANIIMSSNPIFDNALGFLKVGESIWQGK